MNSGFRKMALARKCTGVLVCISFAAAGLAQGGTIGPVLFVDADAQGENTGSSWPNAFTELQSALTAARNSAGDVRSIWVAQGVYVPGLRGADRTATFSLIEGVSLFGGFAGGETVLAQRDFVANRTVLTGDFSGDDREATSESTCCQAHLGGGCDDSQCRTEVCKIDDFCCSENWDATCVLNTQCVCGNLCSNRCDNAYHVVSAVNVGSSAKISGFVITGGNANGANENGRGGGVFLRGGAPIISQCLITDNAADFGGGIFQTGGGRIVSCRIVQNRAEVGGGAFHDGGQPIYYNCVFSGNSARGFGAALNLRESGTVALANSTIVGNDGSSGSVNAELGARLILINSILWGNTGGVGNLLVAQLRTDLISSATVNYSILEGLNGTLGGLGNTGADPALVDADGADDVFGTDDDDLRLGDGSSAIDAGSNIAIAPDFADLDLDGIQAEPTPQDLAGRARRFDDPSVPNTGEGENPIVDIGAIESTSDCNKNSIFDDLDVSSGRSSDCNRNNVPDECEITVGSTAIGGPFWCRLDCASDCNNNGVPDDCEPDGDRDAVINDCDLCPATALGIPVDDAGCPLRGACCFTVGACFDGVTDINCAALSGHFLGYGLGCQSDPDSDGIRGCADRCPRDPMKDEPGVCGCGVADTDADGDGVENCIDPCPRDNPDDADGDGLCNSDDPCPNDNTGDTDGDGVCDSVDPCPHDNPDDSDGDNVCNSQDGCPSDPGKSEPGQCGCGVADVDSDSDFLANCLDQCPGTPIGTAIDENGCPAVGACCFPIGICLDEAARGPCALVGGTYQGNGTECGEGCAFAGDLNRDTVVDLLDHRPFLFCLSGPSGALGPHCDLADFDGNARIDLRDIAGFQRALTTGD